MVTECYNLNNLERYNSSYNDVSVIEQSARGKKLFNKKLKHHEIHLPIIQNSNAISYAKSLRGSIRNACGRRSIEHSRIDEYFICCEVHLSGRISSVRCESSKGSRIVLRGETEGSLSYVCVCRSSVHREHWSIFRTSIRSRNEKNFCCPCDGKKTTQMEIISCRQSARQTFGIKRAEEDYHRAHERFRNGRLILQVLETTWTYNRITRSFNFFFLIAHIFSPPVNPSQHPRCGRSERENDSSTATLARKHMCFRSSICQTRIIFTHIYTFISAIARSSRPFGVPWRSYYWGNSHVCLCMPRKVCSWRYYRLYL